MSKSTYHIRLSASASTTPDLDNQNSMDINNDIRRQTSSNDKRNHNVNYVRHVLRKFFGNHHKKSSTTIPSGEFSYEHSPTLESPLSPILTHPSLEYEKHSTFSGELLFDWFLMHFDNRYENFSLVKQVIFKCFTCLITLGVLRVENNQTNDLFQTQNFYSWATNLDDEDVNVKLSPPRTNNKINHHLVESKENNYRSSTATTIFQILKNEYGFHSDLQSTETNCASTQVDLLNKIDQSTQTDQLNLSIVPFPKKCLTFKINLMSSPLVSKPDSDCEPSSSTFHCNNQITFRRAMHKLLSCDNSSDPSSFIDDDDDDNVHSSVSSSVVLHPSQSFKNNHAKFTSELLLEWLALNCDSKNSSSQTFIQQLKLSLHSNSNHNSIENDLRKALNLSDPIKKPKSQTSIQKEESLKYVRLSYEQIQNINDDVRSLLSDLIVQVDTKTKLSHVSSPISNITQPSLSASLSPKHSPPSSPRIHSSKLYGSLSSPIEDTQPVSSPPPSSIDAPPALSSSSNGGLPSSSSPSSNIDVQAPPPCSSSNIPPPPPFPSFDAPPPPLFPSSNIPPPPPFPNSCIPPPPPFPGSTIPPPPPFPNSCIPPPPPFPNSCIPPPPPFPGSTIPPPPPFPGSNIPPPPPFPNSCIPPPPPFFPGLAGPPPPPPLPGFCVASTTNGGGPPPPPPPPPMMMSGFGGLPQLPQYLRKKQKYAVNEPVKKVQWSKINPHTIKKDSMWVHVDEEKYVNDELFSDIRKNFASKAPPSRQPIHDLVDKSKELRVLDSKAAQNFAIMFSQLKVPPTVFREWMLSCDSEYLKYDFLKQLEKYLPTAEELKKLADLKSEINDLQYSEQYFSRIGDIKRLKQRLQTLLFKANYKETFEETDKAFIEVRNACEHVRHSIRFKKMLELILTIGNYMNSSAKSYEPVHGFDISFLPKLHSTKANDGRRSLLHFIVQAIEDKHRDLLSFSDEFYTHADSASKISILELQKQPKEIGRELKSAREELNIAKNVEQPIVGDKFVESIENFIMQADNDVTRLEQLNEEMTQSYQNLCDFLAIDQKNYSLNEFFTDLKSFCSFFSTCLQEVRAWREQAARAAKTSNIHSSVEKRTQDTPDDSTVTYRRPLSRIEDLIEKRKTNRGLTPTKRRSQS